MTDLTDFLLARIAEDEAVARAATGAYGRWELDDGDDLDAYEVAVFPERGGSTCIARTWPTANGLGDAQHIARHDPARVLAECDAKRRIVEQATAARQRTLAVGKTADPSDLASTLRVARSSAELRAWQQSLQLLALPYADRPDYREEWRP